MSRFRPPRPRPLGELRSRLAEGAGWRELYLAIRRNQVARILALLVTVWAVGTLAIHWAEFGSNREFARWFDSTWNVWVLIFSGPQNEPRTVLGRLLAMALMGLGVGLAGLFTGSVASILVTERLRSRDVSNFEMEDHLVLCNWSGRGLPWVREVHSKIIQDKRPVVIIHDQPEHVDLPDKHDDPAFNDVYIVKGDPTSEVILRRARVGRAHSVVVLADDRQGEHADGKTILTCIAIRNLTQGKSDVNVAVECRNVNNQHHLRKAGADEIISSDELGLRLLARTALFHGMTHIYQELLTVGRDANEIYSVDVPPILVGRDFVEIAGLFVRYRDDKRSCLLLGVQRGEEMILNPVGAEAGPLGATDQLILLSRTFLTPTQTLPTVPALDAGAAPA